MWEAIQPEQDHSCHRLILTGVLPPGFKKALDGTEELLVGSREDGRERAVRAWFVVTADHEIYLFNYAYALRVARWRNDPWTRLTIPGGGPSVEGRVRFVDPGELDTAVQEMIVERWGMWGAPDALPLSHVAHHVLARVEVP